jgi:hypothetical protein
MGVGVNIINFEDFSMEWQQFYISSIFDVLVTACTKKMLLKSSCETPDSFDRFHPNLECIGRFS